LTNCTEKTRHKNTSFSYLKYFGKDRVKLKKIYEKCEDRKKVEDEGKKGKKKGLFYNNILMYIKNSKKVNQTES
jgi:hypothetical protein